MDIENKESFYISRIKPNIAVYLENNDIEYYKNCTFKKSSLFRTICILEIMKQMRNGYHYEIKDAYIGKGKKLKTRFILYKLIK